MTGLIFTAIVYNIKFPDFIYRYVTIALFYFFCTVFFKKPQYGSPLLNCMLIALPSIIIDGSVLLTAPNLVPLRFPFSSIFPVLGCVGGYFVIKRKYKLAGVLALLFVLFSVVSFIYIIPRIIYSMEQVNTTPVKASFLQAKFLDRHGDSVRLDAYRSDWLFVDLFFVGCKPCVLKEKMFSELVSERKENNYRIVIICDGSISTFKAFSEYVKSKPEDSKMIYLYDFNSNIEKFLTNVNGYPHEVVFKNGVSYKSYSGFNEQSFQVNKRERIKLIENNQ